MDRSGCPRYAASAIRYRPRGIIRDTSDPQGAGVLFGSGSCEFDHWPSERPCIRCRGHRLGNYVSRRPRSLSGQMPLPALKVTSRVTKAIWQDGAISFMLLLTVVDNGAQEGGD